MDQEILKKPLVIFSLTYCPWCKKAKTLLKPFKPAHLDIDTLSPGKLRATRKALKKRSGIDTYPQIFYKGRFVGGYTTVAGKLRGSTQKKSLNRLLKTR